MRVLSCGHVRTLADSGQQNRRGPGTLMKVTVIFRGEVIRVIEFKSEAYFHILSTQANLATLHICSSKPMIPTRLPRFSSPERCVELSMLKMLNWPSLAECAKLKRNAKESGQIVVQNARREIQ
jgi:hypothetical protein